METNNNWKERIKLAMKGSNLDTLVNDRESSVRVIAKVKQSIDSNVQFDTIDEYNKFYIKHHVDNILKDANDIDMSFVNDIKSGLIRTHIIKLYRRIYNYNIKSEHLREISTPNTKRYFAKLRKNINGLYKRIYTTMNNVNLYSVNGIEFDGSLENNPSKYISPYTLCDFSVKYMTDILIDNIISINRDEDGRYYIESNHGTDDSYTKEQCIEDWSYFTEMIDKVIIGSRYIVDL